MGRPLIALVATLLAGGARAAPTDYVHTPGVDYGEKEIDVKFGSAHEADGSHRAASIGFGWTPLRPWLTELNAHWQDEPDTGRRLRAFEWENKFQLTEPGRYPVELGLLVEVEWPANEDDARELIVGALLERTFGRTRLNANVILEREFGGDAEPGEDRTLELAYQWQVRYAWLGSLHVGAQGFGGVGAWDDWAASDAQQHAAGPALFGHVQLGDDQEIDYNAALLFAAGGDTPDRTFRLQVEFEF